MRVSEKTFARVQFHTLNASIYMHTYCIKCGEAIFLNDVKSEKHFGLNSVFTIFCKKCSTLTAVPTGKFHKTSELITHSDVNSKAVLGNLLCLFICSIN